jgi:hypothetical protein
MLAYQFRFVDEIGQPTGYCGVVFGMNKKELFWEIDCFGNPNAVEVKTATAGGFCFRGIELDDDELEQTEIELSDPMVSVRSKWHKPEWPDDVYK